MQTQNRASRVSEMDRVCERIAQGMKMPLSTSLSAIRLAQEKLQISYPEAYHAEYAQYFEIAMRNLYEAMRLANNLVDAARIQEIVLFEEFKSIDLTQLMKQTIGSIRSYVKFNKTEIIFEPANQPIYIDCDTESIVRAIMDLISNASSALEPDGGVIRVILKTEGSEASICITDTGSGIAQEELPRVFEEYWCSKEFSHAKQGLGLGLFLVKTIVERHGGHIDVQSELGVGSAFTIKLPCQTVPARHKTLLRSSTEPIAQNTLRLQTALAFPDKAILP